MITLDEGTSERTAVADPGFPVGGGRALVRRGVDLRRRHFSVKMYAKTKELGPRSANEQCILIGFHVTHVG